MTRHFLRALFSTVVAVTVVGQVSAQSQQDPPVTVEAPDLRWLSEADVSVAHVRELASVGSLDTPLDAPLVDEDRRNGVVVTPEGGSKTGAHRSLDERNLWRLEWDNDAFVRVDNGFTDGWSLQRHSCQHDTWREMNPSKFSGWISRTIPGLDDDGERVVKRGSGLSQMTMTPEDVSNPEPQPGDVPWAGSLGWAESWYAFDNRALNAFQIYLGILGPYSFAGAFQVRIHDWINADKPLGWDNQLRTEPLLNLNYAFKRKLVSVGEDATKRMAGDFSIGAEGALGNLVTSAGLTFEGRLGWGLPKGFVQMPDPAGFGIMLDPEKGELGKLHLYFSVVYRVEATGRTVFFDGNLLRQSPHPGLEYDAISHVTIFGFHADRGRYGIHFNFYKYNELPFKSVNPVTDLTWGNITFEYRY